MFHVGSCIRLIVMLAMQVNERLVLRTSIVLVSGKEIFHDPIKI